MDERIMQELDQEAHEDMPRLFALYGVYHRRYSEDDDGTFVGWGMEFADDQGALFWEGKGGATWQTESADSLAQIQGRLGDVRLVWLS